MKRKGNGLKIECGGTLEQKQAYVARATKTTEEAVAKGRMGSERHKRTILNTWERISNVQNQIARLLRLR